MASNKTKKTLKIIGGIAAICFLIVIVIFLWLMKVMDNMCGNAELSSTQIPGTQYKIVVFQRDCGATTGFSTQASIIKTNETLKNNPGNIFSADDNRGGGTVLMTKVYSPHSIELSHYSNARVFRAEQSYRDIKIRYSNITTVNH